MVVIIIVIVIVFWWVLFKIFFGLRICFVGENFEVVDVLGINVELYRFIVVLIVFVLVGVGGVYFSVDWFGMVIKSIVVGRGFIGLVNMVFSNWNLLVVFGGVFLFGFFDNLLFYI